MILIVEPDKELAGAMGELLFDDGFEVCIADSLKYAVGQLPANTVQGVVIDVDGTEVVRIHSARHTATTPRFELNSEFEEARPHRR